MMTTQASITSSSMDQEISINQVIAQQLYIEKHAV